MIIPTNKIKLNDIIAIVYNDMLLDLGRATIIYVNSIDNRNTNLSPIQYTMLGGEYYFTPIFESGIAIGSFKKGKDIITTTDVISTDYINKSGVAILLKGHANSIYDISDKEIEAVINDYKSNRIFQ